MPWYVYTDDSYLTLLSAVSVEEAIQELGLNPEQINEDNYEDYHCDGPGCSYGLFQGVKKVKLLFVEKEVDLTIVLNNQKCRINQIEKEYCAKITKEKRYIEYLKLHAEFGN